MCYLCLNKLNFDFSTPGAATKRKGFEFYVPIYVVNVPNAFFVELNRISFERSWPSFECHLSPDSDEWVLYTASEADAFELNKLYDQWKAQQQPIPIIYPNRSVVGDPLVHSEYEQLELPVGNVEPSFKELKYKKEGRCPTCGELGVFINLGMTCSKHGSY